MDRLKNTYDAIINNDKLEETFNVISQSVFKVNNDGINLVYGLACGINVEKEESSLWIELTTEKLDVALYSNYYYKKNAYIALDSLSRVNELYLKFYNSIENIDYNQAYPLRDSLSLLELDNYI